MKLAVFGGSGATGRVLCREALKRGHTLKLLLRNPSGFSIADADHVELIKGDVLDPQVVTRTIKDSDVVISVIGHRSDSPADLQVQAVRNILDSMRRFKLRRLIDLTGSGVRAPGDRPGLIDRVMTKLLALVDPKRISDGSEHVKLIKTSGLDWTVVRTPVQTNAPAAEKIFIGSVGEKKMGFTIPRENIARFMLDILEDKKYYQKMPAIALVK